MKKTTNNNAHHNIPQGVNEELLWRSMGKEQMYLRENEETVTITPTYKRHSITHFVQHQLKHRTMEISGVHNTMTSQTKDD